MTVPGGPPQRALPAIKPAGHTWHGHLCGGDAGRLFVLRHCLATRKLAHYYESRCAPGCKHMLHHNSCLNNGSLLTFLFFVFSQANRIRGGQTVGCVLRRLCICASPRVDESEGERVDADFVNVVQAVKDKQRRAGEAVCIRL